MQDFCKEYDNLDKQFKKSGEEIPLNARIIGIADAFDAMTANRVYRKAQNLSYVVDELKRCKGSQFDPVLVDVLLRLIENDKIKIEVSS